MQQKTPITIVLDNVRSALNVGAIFRTCDALNCEKLHLFGITPYPPHHKIPKTALGAETTVPWNHTKDFQQLLKELSRPIISVELTSSAQDIYQTKITSPCTLVFGNEISGVSNEFIDNSDLLIKIPMFGKKESLNVATAVGITAYEFFRKTNYDQSN